MIELKSELTGNRVEFSFSVRLVRTAEHLAKAIQVRTEAYGRHVPELGRKLAEHEDSDVFAGTVVFLAEDKDTGGGVGTLRIRTNFLSPLPFERQISLPPFLSNDSLALVERLAVLTRPDSTLIKYALFKALHRYCLATQIRWMLICARKILARQYLFLGFRDVFPSAPPILLPSISPNPLRFLYFDCLAAERNYYQVSHPLYKFMCLDHHPDIDVFSSVSGSWARPRASVVSRSGSPPVAAQINGDFSFPPV
jgi:hypothetical protein